MPGKLWLVLQPSQPHRPRQHHRHQPLRLDLLVLLLLREERTGRSVRIRANPRPGQRNGPSPQSREARTRKLAPDNRRRADSATRASGDCQDHQGGRSRPHPAQHERDQPRTQPQPSPHSTGQWSQQPLHELRRSQPQDQPQEPLGSTLHHRELPKSKPRRSTRPDRHQVNKRSRARRNTSFCSKEHRHCSGYQLPASLADREDEEAGERKVPNHDSRLHREDRRADQRRNSERRMVPSTQLLPGNPLRGSVHEETAVRAVDTLRVRCWNICVRGQGHQEDGPDYIVRRSQRTIRVLGREDRRAQLRHQQVRSSSEIHYQAEQLHRERQAARRTQPEQIARRSLAQARLQFGGTVPCPKHVPGYDALPGQVQSGRGTTTTLRHTLPYTGHEDHSILQLQRHPRMVP